MDHLGIANAPVIGYSMGGTLAMALTIQRPDLVSRLIVAEANRFAGGGAASGRFAAAREEEFVGAILPMVLEKLRAGAASGNPNDAFIAAA